MKKIIAILITLVIVNTVRAQTFQARIQETPLVTSPLYIAAPGSVDVYLRLSGVSPFTAANNRYIGTAQFPIALPSYATAGTPTVTIDPTFLSTISNAGSSYTITVNPVTATSATANAGEKYYSVNIAADNTVLKQIITSGVEFRIMTVQFPSVNMPYVDSIKLLDVTYRQAPGGGNAQAQLAIEDNLANEYTDPFGLVGGLFYSKPARSVNGSAGTTPSLFGIIAGDYNSWSRPNSPILPITLVDFNAVKNDDHSSKVTWTTATENSTDYFEIERSSDAIHFDKVIAHMKAAGESQTTLDYVTYDRLPMNGDNWYRLKSVDIGGKYTYSTAKKVRFDGIAEGISLTSNPISADTKLHITASVDQRIDYTVVDASGRLVSGGSLDVHKGTDNYDFENLSALSGGTYYLTARGATINGTLKISKVN